ncbi:hypothetical protein QWY85_10540 [Neolewinella lacunae]|uniref:Uncharacterized protein n=1 Tax=Neolewinella lacunae TaxID=1517758 RepID=A0A923PN74_9BACT|nr:hypothetical protein [Neolewinella lacunae]MBC6995510.1 hypothetical protein [Neolewinella lacunae]MDN3635098.1 hypothetical protein [Neolewinella lacunae]
MTLTHLSSSIAALARGVDPFTGKTVADPQSCLHDPRVSRKITALHRSLEQMLPAAEPSIPSSVILTTQAELHDLGFSPTAEQIVKVLRGSRAIVDPRLRTLTAYGQYRYTLDVKAMTALVASVISPPTPPIAETSAPPKPDPHPWKEVDFFRSAPFNHLEDTKTEELRRAVRALGLRTPTEKLPAFKARARITHPRSFEPWTREEQGLLIEAMCYTNDLPALAAIFDRTPNALEGMGQRLIYDSQQRSAGGQHGR